MTDTANLGLPLVQPAQAQKHVTVNEALARIDGLAQLTLVSVSETVPPVSPAEGTAYGVPAGAVECLGGAGGACGGCHRRRLGLRSGAHGVAGHGARRGQTAVFDGADWRLGAVTLSPGGASLNLRSLEMDVALSPGASVVTSLAFPARAIVFGVTGRVTAAISGTATGWEIGVAGDTARFGTGLGLAQNSWLGGPGAPVVYWDATPLVVTAIGGDFAAGAIRLVAHFAEIALPASV
jgi:hypothetical protein